MIEIKEKSKCCGCNACLNICPKNCIKMEYDSEGFLYPVVNKDLCIDCNLCNNVCHLVNNKKLKNDNEIRKFYAAYNKNLNILKDSSSGGVFWLMVEEIIKNNGVVYGVEQSSTFIVRHSRSESLKESEKFRKSKYLQSDIGECFKEIKKDLKDNRIVLFSGTPCQVAGLYSYLNNDYENLYTCEVICHGVPSRAVLKKYIDEINNKFNSNVRNIIWRDKINGWGPNHVSLELDDGRKISSISQKNIFQKGFLDNIYLRPSCYECKYAKLPRIADISLADFWGYEGNLIEDNNNNGISLVIVSSANGEKLFGSIKMNLFYHAVDEDYAKSKSRHSYLPPKKNGDRKRFFKDLNTYKFSKLVDKYIICEKINYRVMRKFRRIIDKKIYGFYREY